MAKENREGAQGLSNEARGMNALRYQLGRIKYHAETAEKLNPTEDESNGLDVILDAINTLLEEHPLEGGAEAESLITKGRKAQSKAKESSDG